MTYFGGNCDIAVIGLVSANETALLSVASDARECLLSLFREAEPPPAFALYGPLEAAAYRVAERYRLRIVVKCRLTAEMRHIFGEFLLRFGADAPDVTVTVDFNPTDI